MRNYLKTGMVFIGLLANSLFAADLPKEMYMPNESGGYVVLTIENCQFPQATQLGFDHRAYATETDSEKPATHEGCWNSPDTREAPNVPGVTIIPLVNLWFDGDIVTYPQHLFGPEKRRWDETKPNV